MQIACKTTFMFKTIFLAIVVMFVLGVNRLAAEETNIEKQENPIMEPVLPMILNLFPGFCVGSFVQGDQFGGWVGCIGEGAGVGLFGAGFICALSVVADAMMMGKSGIDSKASQSLANVLMGTGMAVFLGAKVFEVIRPWVFYDEFSKMRKYASALDPYAAPEFSCDRIGIQFGLQYHAVF